MRGWLNSLPFVTASLTYLDRIKPKATKCVRDRWMWTRPGLDEIKLHRFSQMEFFNRFITVLAYIAKANEYPFVKLLQACRFITLPHPQPQPHSLRNIYLLISRVTFLPLPRCHLLIHIGKWRKFRLSGARHSLFLILHILSRDRMKGSSTDKKVAASSGDHESLIVHLNDSLQWEFTIL